MSNPHRGEVSFDDHGKSLVISYSTNAMCTLEEVFEMSTPEIGELLSNTKSFRMTHLRQMFWVGLLDHHPQMTLDEAGLILSRQAPGETISLVTRAYELAFPPQEGGAARPPEAAKPNGGGKTSSPPGKPLG